MKFLPFSMAIITFAISSCNIEKKIDDKKIGVFNISLSSKNEQAITYFRQAEIHKLNNEYVEAREDYRAALRLDPNMILALTEINEPNLNLAREYRNRAINNLSNSNNFEKLFLEYDTLRNNNYNRKIKQEISKKVINQYPDKIDGYIMLALSYSPYDENESK